MAYWVSQRVEVQKYLVALKKINEAKDETEVDDLEQHSFNQFIQCLIIKDVLERCEEAEVGLPSKFQRNCWAAMMESHSNNAKSTQTFIREGISVPLEEDGLTLEELYNMYTYHANDCTKQILLIN